MYSVKIRDHVMIAHSLPDLYFGPASQMHGATYVVDAEFFSEKLNPHNVVVDIGFAQQIVKEVLGDLNYQNLDEMPQFKGQLTTTEYLAKYVHDQLSRRIKSQFQGKIRVTLGESPVAWAAYEGNGQG
jgi:6-pyruvoyl-tetrahydropterin synthase